LIGCGYFVRQLIRKVQHNPIIIYSSEEAVSITEIPFPAFTFCPEILTVIDDFDYEEIVERLRDKRIHISSLTEHE